MRINSVEPTFANITDNFDGFGASPDGLGMTVRTLGEDLATQQVAVTQNPARSALFVAYSIASLAGTAIGAYHGYKRNDSVGWAIGWALLGGLFPIVVIPVAYAQGIGERK